MIWVSLISAFAAAKATGDWPAYGFDARRGHLTQERLDLPLQTAWRYTPKQPAAPAWPEPVLEMHRVDFDYAFQPVIAGGRVFFASSADDSLRAMDLASGKPLWRFTADAPLRFAPHIAGNRCYIAGDDGFVYCLEAATGKPAWQRRVALDSRQVVGNGRMISRWPCRAGVLVADNVVYVAAGMWPSEGIFVYALDAGDGRELWCNDTSGARFMLYPHGGSYAIGGVAPQGYLLASEDKLLIPTGRSVPAAFDRRTGRLLYYRADLRADGGWRVTLAGEKFYGDIHAERWPMATPQEKYGPRPGDGLRRYDLATGNTNDILPGSHFIVPAGETDYVATDGFIKAVKGKAVAWAAPHKRVFAMARTADALLVGGSNSVTALDLATGKELWRGETDGEARGIAVADRRMIIATHRGTLTCFAAEGKNQGTVNEQADADPLDADKLPEHPDAHALFKGIDLRRLTAGYALVDGADRSIIETLLKHTGLNLVVADGDQARVDSLRAYFLDRTRLYGSRIAVRQSKAGTDLPYPDFFANLIVVGPGSGATGMELYRVLRPCGGTLLFQGLAAEAVKSRLAGVPLQPGEYHAGAARVVRGKLPGALDWNSNVASDQRLAWPIELAWFGGPGPSRLINRHGTGLPIAANGRFFVLGANALIAVDAYNGVEFWDRAMPGLPAKVGFVAADDDTVYVHQRGECLALDAQTGRLKTTYSAGVATGSDKVRPWADLPAHAREPVLLPQPVGGSLRENPLTGEEVVQTYRRAHGCGSFVSSATMHFFRSATYGIYDLADDSGLRNFSGARPSCAMSMLPALGLLIAVEGSGGCTCSYNFQSSFALAPAHRSGNEDWAIFFDETEPGIVRRLALNLGAPGDRRDAEGRLWLAVPRPATGLQLDCALEVAEELGPERLNADRTPIGDTNIPWVFGSGIVGLKRLALGLERAGAFVSLAVPRPPGIDGALDDAAWDGRFPLAVTGEKSAVFLRHDGDNLYIAYDRPSAIDRLGATIQPPAAVKEKDGPIWEGDDFEVTLSDSAGEKALHLGLSATGARYDATWQYADPFPAFDIPRLEGIRIDARSDDWGDSGFRLAGLADMQGFMRKAENLDPSFRIGWDTNGLVVFAAVRDDAVVEYPLQPAMWQKDSLEIFMAESRDSDNRFQLCIGPGADGLQPKARAFFWDKRDRFPTPLEIEVAGARTADGYAVEFRLPWSNLGIKPMAGREVALQLMVNDADVTGSKAGDWFRVAWHPDGHTAFKKRALQRLRLSDIASPPWIRERLTPPDKRGLSKGGIRLEIPPIDIPEIAGIVIDGDVDDWRDSGYRVQSLPAQNGTMRAPENFDPSFRLGWDSEGLLLAAQIRDQAIFVDQDLQRLWRKDSLELFFTPQRGAPDPRHLTIAPPADASAKQPVVVFDNGGTTNQVQAQARRTADGYFIEARVPWQLLGSRKPAPGAEIALQLFFNDADKANVVPGDSFRAAWYPLGHAGWDALAYHRVRLTGTAAPAAMFARGARVNDELLAVAGPTPWPFPEAVKGTSGEDNRWDGEWKGSARSSEGGLACELAIPWRTVEKAGLDRESLTIDFSRRGRLLEKPAASFMPLYCRREAAAPARPYTVRLHFAELRAIAPGTRVFDVALQGKPLAQDLDVVERAGGARRALTLEIPHVMAATNLTVELVPKSANPDWNTAPILNGLDIAVEKQ